MTLPKVDFLGKKVSRLIVGCNPFSGSSYLSPEADEEMHDYYTANRIAKTLMHAQEIGYTDSILFADSLMLRMLREYRQMGGTMDWIAQVPEFPLPPIMKGKPWAMYFQGGLLDHYIANGQEQKITDTIKKMKDCGIYAGIASHKTENLELAEEKNWGADFYMACLHRKPDNHVSSAISGITDSGKENPFIEGTRPVALKFIKQCSKPCIAYKIFRGGYLARQTPELLRASLEEVYANIKPTDIATVGIFQKYKDQLQQNSDLVCDILNSK